MFNLETNIKAWRSQFQYNRTFLESDVDELETHIRDQVQYLVSRGLTEEAAFHEAIEEMGGQFEAATEYKKIYWAKRRHYHVLRSEIHWRITMLTSYLRLAYRNLLKNKTSTAINVLGLSIAVACSIVIYLFLQLNLNMDSFHDNASNTFLIGNTVVKNGNQYISDRAPMPLGAALANDLPQIKQVVRIENGGQITVQLDGLVFKEPLWFADKGFFDLFTFPLANGNPSLLSDKDAIFLSTSAARRFFGNDEAVGKSLTIKFTEDDVRVFTVRGVAEPFPPNASFSFNLLVNFALGPEVGGDEVDDWRSNTLATFIQLNSPADLPIIQAQMDRYKDLQNDANDVWPISDFTFTNLLAVSRNAHKASTSISQGVNPTTLIVFPIIALFLLALSSFNYMNISLSQSTHRLREIGVRKVMGSARSQLIFQFLSENILLCLSALIIGTVLAYFFLLPGFNAFFDGMPPLTLSLTSNVGLWGFFFVMLIVTGIASGAYPAFYVSSLNPSTIFQGKHHKQGGTRRFTRGILTVQFVITFFAMTAGLVFYRNTAYQVERDWGYNQEQTLVVRLTRDGQYNLLTDELRRYPNILSLAGSIHHIMPRGSGPGGSFDIPGGQVESRRYDVDYNYPEVMGLRLKAGRFFDSNRPTDAASALIVNEAFVRSLNLTATEAIGLRLPWGENTTYNVVGVVDDFHSNDFSMQIQPALFRVIGSDQYEHLVLRLDAGSGAQTEVVVEEIWQRLFPEEVYSSFFQDTVFNQFYRENKNISRVFSFAAFCMLFISCMGLYGITAQNISQRMREVTIRKVLGASASNIVKVINRDFFRVLIIAAIVAVPGSYFMLDALLASMYEYHVGLEVVSFLYAFALVIIVALLTIGMHLQKLNTANPSVILRNN